jgi:hypothetical protein
LPPTRRGIGGFTVLVIYIFGSSALFWSHSKSTCAHNSQNLRSAMGAGKKGGRGRGKSKRKRQRSSGGKEFRGRSGGKAEEAPRSSGGKAGEAARSSGGEAEEAPRSSGGKAGESPSSSGGKAGEATRIREQRNSEKPREVKGPHALGGNMAASGSKAGIKFSPEFLDVFRSASELKVSRHDLGMIWA